MRRLPEQVSPNFRLSEFRCPCCGRVVFNPLLVLGLQWLRNRIDKPIEITSGYRCFEHNATLPMSSSKSQHLYGTAADIRVAGMTPQYLADCAETVPYFETGGIGIYDVHVHVDVRDGKARWDMRTKEAP